MEESVSPTGISVRLISYTPEPENVIIKAIRVCYKEKEADSVVSPETMREVIRRVIRRGHLSVIEHISFTFLIDGISRACSHQLVRHRIASYSQQSQRYVDFEGLRYIIPPTIAEDDELDKRFREHIAETFKLYRELREAGVPSEDARFVLPNASATRIIFTMNARELMHFLRLRLCRRAQWEIREVAIRVGEILSEIVPSVFRLSAPSCAYGPCPEGDMTCGDPYRPPWYEEE